MLKKAILSALGVTAYIALVATLMSHEWLTQKPGVLTGVLMLLVFVISASITGSLVLLRPVLMYLDGSHREAVKLLVSTIAALVAIAIVVALTIVMF